VARTTIPVTQLDPAKTRRAINRRTRRPETIAAWSANGRWSYGREDDAGTRWYVRDLTTGQDIRPTFGNLTRARRWTYELDPAARQRQRTTRQLTETTNPPNKNGPERW
jgi:hypothetical protein